METSCFAEHRISVQELLQCRSPLSVHQHLSSFKRKRSDDDDERQQRPHSSSDAFSECLPPASETLSRQKLSGSGLSDVHGPLSVAHSSLAQEKDKRRVSSIVLKKMSASETLTDQNEAGRVLLQHNGTHRLPGSETRNNAGMVLSARNSKSQTICSKYLKARSQVGFLRLSEEPFVLMGWIQLWNNSLYGADCLAFSDCSGTSCCVVRDFDPQLLGYLVRLLSWSYIPKREKGGCLEIRRLVPVEFSSGQPRRTVYLFPEMANSPNQVLETPPSKQNTKSQRLAIAGCVSFISPPFAIPYGEVRSKLTIPLNEAHISIHGVAAAKSKHDKFQCVVASPMKPNKPLLGFFVGLAECKHKPCCPIRRLDDCQLVGLGDCEAVKQHAVSAYFSGATAAWRPILLATSGKCILLTGLRRKVLMAGEDKIEHRIYAATRRSSVILCISSPMEGVETRHGNSIVQRKALDTVKEHKCQVGQRKQVGSYVGIVTEIFLRGGLLELDGCVWLLLTHQPLSQVHAVRVGATIRAVHVHFLKVTSFFEEALLLAACSISHVVVTHFSPLQTVYAGKAELQSHLSRFIASISFVSAFWALQAVASFKQKFRGFYNEKEILGSVKHMGIAETYLRNSSRFSNAYRRNVLEEFFSHSTFCSLAKLAPCHFLLQVPPIGNFCKQIQLMWHDQKSCIWNKQINAAKRENQVHELKQNRNTFFRHVISSDLLGLTALGFLQFSSVLGKLQLVDATGAVDVIIPDLETAQCFQGACQVTTYKLVIEGYLEPSSVIDLDQRSFPLSWYSNLKGKSFSMEPSKQLSFFLIFSIKEASFVHYIRHDNFAGGQPSRKIEAQPLFPIFKTEEQNTSSLDMIFVLHKYPISFKEITI